MRRWVIGLITFIALTLMALWLWRILQPSEVIEVRAKILPIGFVSLPYVRDLDGDGNDELLVRVSTQPWLGRSSERVFVVTMRNRRLIAHPTPFTFAEVSSTGGRQVIGIIESGKQREVAVGEWLPDGRWEVEKLGAKANDSTVTIGDWDGDNEDNTALVLSENGAKVLVFQKRPKSQWGRVKEIKMSRVAQWISGEEWGAKVYASGGIDFPLFFWRGQWQLGQPNERVAFFKADWDGDGQLDKLLVRVSPDSKNLTTHLTLETDNPKNPKEYLSHQWHFTDWEVCHYFVTPSVATTDQLGDGRWHLLVLLVKSKPLTLRLMDFRFSPNRNWQVAELARWQVKGINLPADVGILVGDSDDDGRAEIFVVSERRSWRLLKTGSGWQPQALSFPSQSGILGWTKVGKRLWFFRFQDRLLELGNFRADGRWETKWKTAKSLRGREAVNDLNGDELPEVLVFQGEIFPRPIIWWQTENAWRKQELVGSSLLRVIEGWLHSPDVFPSPGPPTVAKFEGKKWFVVLWSDGVVQAVTLRH